MKSVTLKNIRSSGVLLHPTALPGAPLCGTLGRPSRDWLRFLSEAGIRVWQFLPLSPTDSTGSPYSSPSAFALNPWLLDVEDLAKDGFIPISEIDTFLKIETEEINRLDFKLLDQKVTRLSRILRENWCSQNFDRHQSFSNWCDSQFWLDGYVQFKEISNQYDHMPWWKWPPQYLNRQSVAIDKLTNEFQKRLLEHKLIQWHLYRQWDVLQNYASKLGIYLFGDMPFYVSRNSADVWSNKELFSILPNGEIEIQSGVPPDYFSSTGQLWGTPVYNWETHIKTNFRWWRERFKHQWDLYDFVRLDHFRALEAYWAVPGDKPSAEKGSWKKSPGKDLLTFLQKDFGESLPLIAEDLGIITPAVESLRDQFKLPGMKILQFAFDGNQNNPYLPENIKGSYWVVYTGTHDNATTLGWWNSLDQIEKERVQSRIKDSSESPVWQIIDMGLSTEASLFIAPLQDLLELDNCARFNTPGTINNNWRWRISSFDCFLEKSLKRYAEKSVFYGRT